MKIQTCLYAMMAGVTVGFAIWGAQGTKAWCPPARYSPVILTTPEDKVSDSDELSLIQRIPAATEVTAEPDHLPKVRQELLLHAQSAVLLDGDSGRVLYEKAADTPRPMASTTKIMTCILALEKGELSDICTVSGNASAQPKVRLGVHSGQKFLLEDLLYSLMLESHNDSAVVIAEHIGGSVEKFAGMMNRKARSIGCKQTFFVTPNGLDATAADENGETRAHSTTAEDLAKILRYCIRESPKKEEFLKITRSAGRTFSDQDGKNSYYCANHNAFLQMMEGALTGKTGFTGGAGYCYVSALESEGRLFILALLGCGWPPHRTWKWEDARMLFSYGKQNFSYQDCYQTFEARRIPVEGSERGKTVAVDVDTEKEDQTLFVLLQEGEQVKRQVDLPEILHAPVRKGEKVGEIRYLLGERVIRTEKICAEEDAYKWNLFSCIRSIFEQYMQEYLKK